MYIIIIVVFLTVFSIRVSLLSSKIHNGGDTAKEVAILIIIESSDGKLKDNIKLSTVKLFVTQSTLNYM